MCPNACSTRTRPRRTTGDDGSESVTEMGRHRRRGCPIGVVVFFVLLLVQLQVSIARGNEEADFTNQCNNCKCSWKSGRRNADCTNQQLPDVPQDLSNELQVLDLSNNQIGELPSLIFMSAQQTNLQKLYLRNNSMKRADRDAFRNLTILIELDLANNNLSSLEPGIFDDLSKIRVIILNNNQLERIEKNLFRGLVHLAQVHLQSNRLVRIALNSFVDVPKLKQIALDYNRLQTLRMETFSGLENLNSLSLTNNRWNCSCALRAFSKFVLDNKFYTSPTVCTVPEKLSGLEWNVIKPEDFACPPNIIENRMQFPSGGTNATFVCKVTGLPLPTIDWLFQKRPLSLHDQRKLVRQAVRINERDQSEMHVSELTIFGVRHADRGSYVCQATNTGGVDESELFFDLKTDPQPIVSATRSKDVLWIVLIVVLVLLILVVLALVLWCVCRRVRRFKKNSTMSENGLLSTKIMDKSQNDSILEGGSVVVELQKNLLTEVNPVEKPPRRVDIDAGEKVLGGVGSGGSDYDEKHEVKRTLLEETGFVAQDEETASVALSDSNPRSRATYVDDGCGTNLPPDLLAFPSRFPPSPSIQSSLSNIHDGRIYGKSPLASPIYQMGPGTSSLGGPGAQVPAGFRTLQHPKTGRTIAVAAGRSNSPFTPAPLIYPQVALKHQGYVTIPRKPRTPSWTPSMSSAVTAEMLPSMGSNPASPTSPIDPLLSVCEPVYDNLGLRTTASGNSTLKLNKAHRGMQPGTPGALTSTPLAKYSMKDRPLPATPGGQTATNPLALGSNYEAIPEKLVPLGGGTGLSLGLPGLNLDASAIYGTTGNGVGTGTMNRSKVPPRPPPKPKKKPLAGGDDSGGVGLTSGPMALVANNSNTNTSTSPLFTDEGDDGTEV